jgi:hypothetical protein
MQRTLDGTYIAYFPAGPASTPTNYISSLFVFYLKTFSIDRIIQNRLTGWKGIMKRKGSGRKWSWPNSHKYLIFDRTMKIILAHGLECWTWVYIFITWNFGSFRLVCLVTENRM